MKKGFFFTVLVFLCTLFAHAQTFDEWVRQKKTQIRYLVNQIAACKVYADYLEKGYNIAWEGLTTIHDIKEGEFNLHADFFNSLKTVNPEINKYSKVADIITYESSIVKDFKKVLQIKNLNASEINYLKSVYSHMSVECTKAIDEVINLVTDNVYQMKDDERIRRIDGIYLDMKDKYAFTQAFTDQTKLLSAQRQKLYDETVFGYRIYGIQF